MPWRVWLVGWDFVITHTDGPCAGWKAAEGLGAGGPLASGAVAPDLNPKGSKELTQQRGDPRGETRARGEHLSLGIV